jgi:DNA transposition AAA+ family ATPase
LNNKYKGREDYISTIVRDYLEKQKESSTSLYETDFIMTSVAQMVFEVARLSHRGREICVCYGPSGVGKTEAVKKYARLNQDVILIEADLGQTAKVLFADIHRKLGLDGYGTVHSMFEDSIARLRGSGILIIVDEAEHLPYKALELLRRVYDKAGIGILLVGMPRLISNLRGRRGEYAQLYSRVGAAPRLGTLRADDTRMIVDSLLQSQDNVWKAFHEASGGNTRTLSKLILRAKRIAELNNTSITTQVVQETAKMLII